MSLHLERLGLKFITLRGPSHSLFLTVLVVCYIDCCLVLLVCTLFFLFSHCHMLPDSNNGIRI
jgi:hypothetical protein